MGPGCLIAKKLSPDVQLEMGIDATGGQLIGYMALYTKADANVTQGQQLPVTFDVDGQPFTGTATAQQMPGFRGGSVPVNNIDFIYNLAKKHKLTITPRVASRSSSASTARMRHSSPCAPARKRKSTDAPGN